MKEFGIFILVVLLSGILYWGIEPYAHHELHPQTAPANYNVADEDISHAKAILDKAKSALEKAKATGDDTKIKNAQTEVANAEASVEAYTSFWNEIRAIDFSKGDATRGADTFMAAGCTGCHGIEIAGMPSSMDAPTASASFGVVPPDLSTAGMIYDELFLAALIKDPTRAVKLNHKFGDEKVFPMTAFFGAGGDVNAEIADIVAYMKAVSKEYAKNNNGISDEKLFMDACQRCHDVRYDNKYTLTNRVDLANYMGSNPPDLSMMIRSKNADYLHKLINDPQKMLTGTAMPRVGLTKESEDQLVTYLEKVGDSKKDERTSIGIYTMIYFLILGVFATLWKIKVWRNLH